MKCLEYWYRSMCAVSCSAVNLDTYFHKDRDPVCVMMFCFPLWRSTDEGFIPAQPSRWVYSTTNKLQRLTAVLLSIPSGGSGGGGYDFLWVCFSQIQSEGARKPFGGSPAGHKSEILLMTNRFCNFVESCSHLHVHGICSLTFFFSNFDGVLKK